MSRSSGATLQDLKTFKETHPLNSRVVKGADGALREEIWRAGTPDGSIPPGLYATYLKKANEFLERARRIETSDFVAQQLIEEADALI